MSCLSLTVLLVVKHSPHAAQIPGDGTAMAHTSMQVPVPMHLASLAHYSHLYIIHFHLCHH